VAEQGQKVIHLLALRQKPLVQQQSIHLPQRKKRKVKKLTLIGGLAQKCDFSNGPNFISEISNLL
jgi:hypothetical protein